MTVYVDVDNCPVTRIVKAVAKKEDDQNSIRQRLSIN